MELMVTTEKGKSRTNCLAFWTADAKPACVKTKTSFSGLPLQYKFCCKFIVLSPKTIFIHAPIWDNAT
jgi:hypothetical protein